eukprot:403354098
MDIGKFQPNSHEKQVYRKYFHESDNPHLKNLLTKRFRIKEAEEQKKKEQDEIKKFFQPITKERLTQILTQNGQLKEVQQQVKNINREKQDVVSTETPEFDQKQEIWLHSRNLEQSSQIKTHLSTEVAVGVTASQDLPILQKQSYSATPMFAIQGLYNNSKWFFIHKSQVKMEIINLYNQQGKGE